MLTHAHSCFCDFIADRGRDPPSQRTIHAHTSTQLLRRFNGDIMVMSVRTDGPAKRSGIHAGDIISAVGQTSVQGMEVEQVMNLLYGPRLSVSSLIRACVFAYSIYPVRR